MAVVANRRSVMTLFSNDACADSHRARIVLAEKGVTVEFAHVVTGEVSEDLMELNPYGGVPTLVDRDLVLYDPRVIMEYLDERFPHPPLMPVDPVSRARSRLAMYRLEQDWYTHIPVLEGDDEAAKRAARTALTDSIASSAEIFAAMPFFLSEEFSLVDCCAIPILWRLPHWGIELPEQAEAVGEYAERMFAREAASASLTEIEQEMRL